MARLETHSATIDFKTLEQLFEHHPRATQIVDRTGQLRYANRAFFALLGGRDSGQPPPFNLRAAGPDEVVTALDDALRGIGSEITPSHVGWIHGGRGATITLTPLHGPGETIDGAILQYDMA